MGAPVRISFVTPHAVLGGAEAVLRSVVLSLPAGAVAGVVVLQDGPLVERLRDDGLRVDVVPTGRRLGMLDGARRLRRVLREQGADVVHANGLKAALVARPALPRGARLLWMKHDATGDPWLTRLVALGCDDVVGVSASVMAPLDRRRRPKTVVHNGLPDREPDRAAGRQLALTAAGAHEPAEIVALVGRYAVGKGQAELLAAMPTIVAARPRARALLVGPTDPAFPGLREDLAAQAARAGLDSHVVLTSERDDVSALLAGCDVVVAPSVRDPGGWREGFGLVAAEAMQAGTPVVVYASGSLPEVVGDAGIVVPEGDRAALAEAVVELLGDEGRRRELGERGRERVRRHFRDTRSREALLRRYAALGPGPTGAGRDGPVDRGAT